MRCLVTGGAGFIGSHLVDKLIEKGEKVTVVDNLSTGKRSNLNQSAVFFEESIEFFNPEYDYDVIFHLAALPRIQPSFKNPAEFYAANSTGTIAALEIARKCQSRFIYASSSSVYYDPLANPYTYTKWLGEEHCKLYNRHYRISTAMPRFFNVYGHRQIEEGEFATVMGIFERQYRTGVPLTVTGGGSKRRDFTHVSDIVEGLIDISKQDHSADIFDLGTGKNYSILEVAEMFGRKIDFLPERPGEAEITKALEENFKQILGWKAKINLEDYVRNIKAKK